ncbi:MAG: aspartate/tyrosine/aromatic aminotransferase [Candidatus Hydrogenedentes bacterium]|nr:aspartate/tyrosine/aromatic aminotransferase [Candidatus Hydrogenedentota bacterium]
MFEKLDMAPPDAILGLTEAFKKDTNPKKINLGTGVFKDAEGRTPILKSVKLAEERLLKDEQSKTYLGIPGAPEYGAVVQPLLFGADHEIVTSGRARTAHTPGGTGGLRVAGEFLKKLNPTATIWMSEPTWANHPSIFQAAGLEVRSYPYYDAAKKGLNFEGMIETLKTVPAGDAVLLHGCCHNPSGMDPDLDQWKAIAAVAREQGFMPLFDLAYQGFAEGLREDTAGLREFCTPGRELIVCSSFSKNFGLYSERVGAMTIVGTDADTAERGFSHVKLCSRANYSNPPSHGGKVVVTVLNDPELRALWEQEVTDMRNHINNTRRTFVETLKAKGVAQDFSFITTQRGMFSFSGLNKAQVERLRDEFGIYIVGSGRINVAGIAAKDMDPLCEAIAAVL